jgi:DNA-binding beta-propeller fold protein YncE/mono/diheme cytochrome c family protein
MLSEARAVQKRWYLVGVAAVAVGWSAPAAALTVEFPRPAPSLVGESVEFRAVVSGAVGAVTYSYSFADGTKTDFEPDRPSISHTYTLPGHYDIVINVKEDGVLVPTGDGSFRHTVHYPVLPARANVSNDIIYDQPRNRIYNVNRDNDTITAIDPVALKKVAELTVYHDPEALALAPDNKLWVLHRDDYAIAIVDPDKMMIERGFRLPYASQPIGLAMSPTGDGAYVTLMATGKLLKLNPTTGVVLAELDVGPNPRGVTVSQDGKDVYVTRFISSDAGGEIAHVDGAAMKLVKRINLAPDTTTLDTDQKGRGLPNYLFSIALSPDGKQAWIPGKKDNIFRGTLKDKQVLDQDSTVRPMVAVLDMAMRRENLTPLSDATLDGRVYLSGRIDLDDRNLPGQVEFSPMGNYALISVTGSNLIEVRDAYTGVLRTAMKGAGEAPRGLVLGPQNRLFVNGSLSRKVVVYDMTDIFSSADKITKRVAEISAVEKEQLTEQVLRGKQLFFNSADVRMTKEGYMSCASCHFDGDGDGRVWDFTDRGEGLRNTTALMGRRGTGQGNVLWSGGLDEIQDFEEQIRNLFGGTGFMSDDDFAKGTRKDALGDKKAGVSEELDALAAFVETLDHVNPSPFRNPDGTMTADAIAGKTLFGKLGCGFCHAGADLTDSARGMLRDVGSLKPSSGKRLGGPLTGIDTPTLLGVWETAPYLHDGSAPTLRDVLTTTNSSDLHGFVSSLKPQEVDQLVAFMLQLDSEIPIRRLPFDPPAPAAVDGGGRDIVTGGGVNAGLGGPSHVPVTGTMGNCACDVPASELQSGAGLGVLSLLAALLGWAHRRPRNPAAATAATTRGGRGRGWWLAVAVAALITSQGACLPEEAGAGGSAVDWSHLPALVSADPELARLGTRQEKYDKLCATPRGDSFFKAMCGSGQRPDLPNMAALLKLVGLDQNRAFALTGNSTSLVSMSVSALNPRIIIFPRVDENLQKPANLTALGFVRGEQFVEVVSRDDSSGDLNFYLVSFEQECSYKDTCGLADLLTEDIEHNWTAFSIYDQQDLEKTSFDCQSCHQPGGFGTKRILRMQELTSPCLHWFPQSFTQRTDSDRVLLAQFTQTHSGDTQYGGVPTSVIANALDEGSGAQLEALIRAEGFASQPNPFDATIASEAASGAPSPTWQARFDVTLKGDAIAVPYPRPDVSDEAKRAAASKSYQDVVGRVAPRETLMDIRQIFSPDAAEKLGFVPKPGADGRTVLLQMCSRCHDGRSNPDLMRSRFNVKKLDQMSRAEKEWAIGRLTETREARMPPWRVGSLTPGSIQAATVELQK